MRFLQSEPQVLASWFPARLCNFFGIIEPGGYLRQAFPSREIPGKRLSPMPLTIVVSDADAGRRRAVVERLPRSAGIIECADGNSLLQTLTRTAPSVVVIGALGDRRS